MKAKLSTNINFPTEDADRAAEFYHRIMGMGGFEQNSEWTKVSDGNITLYFDRDTSTAGPIFEFIVSNLEEARKELIAAGCTVVRWDGPGKPNYIRDPFGFLFNLWEDPNAFNEH